MFSLYVIEKALESFGATEKCIRNASWALFITLVSVPSNFPEYQIFRAGLHQWAVFTKNQKNPLGKTLLLFLMINTIANLLYSMWMTNRNFQTLENTIFLNAHNITRSVTCTPLMTLETNTSTDCKIYQISYLVCLLAKQAVEFFINASALPSDRTTMPIQCKKIKSQFRWMIFTLLTWESASTVLGYSTIYDDFFRSLSLHNQTTVILSGFIGLLSTLFYMLAYTPYTLTAIENAFDHCHCFAKIKLSENNQQTIEKNQTTHQAPLLG